MQAKKKICSGCDTEQYIWKRHEGEPYCKQCWSTHKSKELTGKPTGIIPKVSSKRKKKDEEYSKLRARFLTENSMCQVSVAGCTHYATDVHHTYAGSDREAFYLVQSTWKAACRNCHDYIHGNPSKARALGWLK